MKKNKVMKSLLAGLLSMTMVLGMGMTTLAEGEDPETTTVNVNKNEEANGSSADTVKVTINGLQGNPTVTLYQIAEGDYSADSTAGTFIGYEWVEGITPAMWTEAQTGLHADTITEIVNGIKATPQTVKADAISSSDEKDADDIYEVTVPAGAYIAVITGATGYVYNPILLTASYDASGDLVGGIIDADSTYLYGTTAVAKMTAPKVEKEIDVTTITPDNTKTDAEDENRGDIKTASIGDIITYTITPTIPSYPANAVNKTLFLSDTMLTGLTYNPDSLTININGEAVKANTEGEFVLGEDSVIATLVEVEGTNGFHLNFDYDKLVSDEVSGTTYDFSVTYTATVNETAVAGAEGNVNTSTMYYANDPSQGSTFEPSEENLTPAEADDVESTSDEEVVYTYQVAFKKVDENGNALADAIFGIYNTKNAEGNVSGLVDIVKTNAEGYAVSTNVSAGTYYIKEIQAPATYSLNTEVFDVTANWTTVTTKVEETVTERTYTTDPADASAVQVGWIVLAQEGETTGTFYALDEFTEEDAENDPLVKKAYIDKETTTSTASSITENNGEGAGTALFSTPIPNTKMSSLPSTGGIGTFVFTIGGCLIMVVAAVLLIGSRKKTSEK